MAVLNSHFYHNTISTYTSVFGTCFTDLEVHRKDGKKIAVPLAYAARQKYNVRALEQDNQIDGELIKFMKRSPRMSFMMVGFRRDSARVKSKYHRFALENPNDTTYKVQYNRTPFIFQYRLDLTTKYMDDLLQLMEQISVTFNPSLQVVVKDNPDMEEDSSVLITLDAESLNDAFEGIYDDSRELTASLDFNLEGYLYMPTSSSGVIRTVELNYRDLDDKDILYLHQEFDESDALP